MFTLMCSGWSISLPQVEQDMVNDCMAVPLSNFSGSSMAGISMILFRSSWESFCLLIIPPLLRGPCAININAHLFLHRWLYIYIKCCQVSIEKLINAQTVSRDNPVDSGSGLCEKMAGGYRMIIIRILLLLLLAVPAFAKDPIRTIDGTVVKVSDGDTIQVVDEYGTMAKVRLYGIDAPEAVKGSKKVGQPYGEEAYQALRSKVKGQKVSVDVIDIDKYKRVVSIVRMGQRNINKEMVQEGWAWAYRKYLDRAYASEYITLEDEARKGGRGLWQQSNPQPPWEFRKAQRNKNASDY